ncbi:MAG TPA: hypothetical protein PKW37_01025 [Salinivirgaceae bacterium]|nr:hypothetical protein [Salinivirgaceae bacterium]
MNKEILKRKYTEIESKIKPIVDFLETNKNSKEFKGIYKGIITLQSPIIYKPEIFFLGVNPGDGAYKILNIGKSETIRTPLRMIGKDETSLKELNWYESGNARCKKANNKWVKGYEWYQRDKMVNNAFPQRMIDLLYEIANLKYPDKANKYDNNSLPFWYETFGQKIMYSNLYPIATTNIGDLYKILNTIAVKDEFKWRSDNKKPNNWDVRRFFIRLTDELIDLVQPKTIVCIGKSAYDDFVLKKDTDKKKIFSGQKNKIPVIGFSRRGNWSGLLKEIAQEIISTKTQ